MKGTAQITFIRR